MEHANNWIATIQKLSNVQRYSQAALSKSENVLEHSALVSLIALHIANSLIADGVKNIDIGKIVIKCLIHDIEESEIGDIASPAKYHNENIASSIKEMEKAIAREIFEESGIASMYSTWATAKKYNTGVIVAFADSLTVLIKTHDEIVLRGNKTLARVIKDLEFNPLKKKYRAMAILYQADNKTITEYRTLIETMITEIQGALK
jgi:5'-deoxynucleotidase YfbR-like HD superfamily hydrolase